MTSFGATKVIQENVMSTSKIQGQIYHHVYSLLRQDNVCRVGWSNIKYSLAFISVQIFVLLQVNSFKIIVTVFKI